MTFLNPLVYLATEKQVRDNALLPTLPRTVVAISGGVKVPVPVVPVTSWRGLSLCSDIKSPISQKKVQNLVQNRK